MNFPGEFHTCRKWGFFWGDAEPDLGLPLYGLGSAATLSVVIQPRGQGHLAQLFMWRQAGAEEALSTPTLLLTWIQLQEWALRSWDHPYGAAPAPARLGCSEPCAQSRADPGMLWATQGRCLCPCARAGASQVPEHFRLEKFPPEWVESLVPPAPVITPCEPAQLFSHVCKEEKAQIWQFSSFIPPK